MFLDGPGMGNDWADFFEARENALRRPAVKQSDLERAFSGLVVMFGLPEPAAEYRFHPTRRWRFDYAYPDAKVAVELEGGTWVNGRHTRGGGFEKDAEKYNAAVLLGWRVLRFTRGMLDDDPAGCMGQVAQLLGVEVEGVEEESAH